MFDCNALLYKFSTPAGELMILLCLLYQQKEKKYDIFLRETENPIEAKKLTPWLLLTHPQVPC
jgi:hypothetical protein